ncbi:type-1 angiotensin II receptor-associated protein isoform X2 [Amia ocellicauda]|uniref:type-1 angiotensin II receptor-associated protein isoform X2 n=1 Tax=Amia ocellicauda TaxID=2972642 RepID=UPI0034644895
MEVPAINLKAIILVHWLLTVWSCMFEWFPSSYTWSNFSVLGLGVWAVAQRDSIDAVLMFLISLVLTILTDIIQIAIYYPIFDVKFTGQIRDTFHFCAGMSILSLLLKPVSCFFVYQMYRERGGEYNVNFGFPSMTRNRDSYQSIDPQDTSPAAAHQYAPAEEGKAGPRVY